MRSHRTTCCSSGMADREAWSCTAEKERRFTPAVAWSNWSQVAGAGLWNWMDRICPICAVMNIAMLNHSSRVRSFRRN